MSGWTYCANWRTWGYEATLNTAVALKFADNMLALPAAEREARVFGFWYNKFDYQVRKRTHRLTTEEWALEEQWECDGGTFSTRQNRHPPADQRPKSNFDLALEDSPRVRGQLNEGWLPKRDEAIGPDFREFSQSRPDPVYILRSGSVGYGWRIGRSRVIIASVTPDPCGSASASAPR